MVPDICFGLARLHNRELIHDTASRLDRILCASGQQLQLPVQAKILLLLGWILALSLCFVPITHAQIDSEVGQWVEAVILGPEFGGNGDICMRWEKTPSLAVFDATAAQEKIIADTVARLNEILTQTPIGQIELLKANDEHADIRVYFAPLAEIPRLAQEHDVRYVEGNWGYVWMFPNRNYEIKRAFVFLAADKLYGKHLRHFALEEITQALGLANDSSIFADSIFYARGEDGGDAQHLSVLDEQLIRFFYNHVQPGAQGREIRLAFQQYWEGTD